MACDRLLTKKHLTAIRRILKQFKPLYHKNACPHS
nr:MAG TPA: hypothetical protein [Caudoviricetes sp.]